MNTIGQSIIYEFEKGHKKGYFKELRKNDKKQWFLHLVDVLIDMKKRHILYLNPEYYKNDYELKTWDTINELLFNLMYAFENRTFFNDEGMYFAELMINILATKQNGYYGEPNAILYYIEEYISPTEFIAHLKEKKIDTSTIESVWNAQFHEQNNL